MSMPPPQRYPTTNWKPSAPRRSGPQPAHVGSRPTTCGAAPCGCTPRTQDHARSMSPRIIPPTAAAPTLASKPTPPRPDRSRRLIVPVAGVGGSPWRYVLPCFAHVLPAGVPGGQEPRRMGVEVALIGRADPSGHALGVHDRVGEVR